MLLLPYDDSPASQRAAELLCAFRGASRPAVSVLNVQQPPAGLLPEAALEAASVEQALLETGEGMVKAAAGRLAACGLRTTTTRVRLGFAAPVILEEAAAQGVEAVVMGTRGHGMLHGFAVGSVALRVAHGGAVPTLLVKPEARLPRAPGERLKVLLAVDGSEASLRAARKLAGWRSRLGELEVHLVHVQEPLTFLETVLPPHNDVIDQWSTNAAEAASKPAREILSAAGIANRLHIDVGDAGQQIARLADEIDAELIVTGTRGRGAAHHAFIGSVALKAVAASHVPVLLVP